MGWAGGKGMGDEQGMLGNLQPKWLEGRCALGSARVGR